MSGLFFGAGGTLPVYVTVNPPSATLLAGQVQTFVPAVANTDDPRVTWSLSPNVGTITSGGVYTAPSSFNVPQQVTLTATSVFDNSKSTTVTISLVLPAAGATVQFVRQDITTQGTWKGVYGTEGYNVVNNAMSYPSYVTALPVGNSAYTWLGSTTDVRALQQASGTSRIAGVWYSGDKFVMDLAFSDTQVHQVALYCLDWDNIGRSEKFELVDPATSILDTRTITNFGGGVWLVWNVSGHVQLRVTKTAGLNAVVSGLFFK